MKNIAQLLKRFVARTSETPAVTPAALLIPLEPRIVYDASVAAVGASHHHADLAERAAGRAGISESAAELFRNSAAFRAIAGSHEGEASGSSRSWDRGAQQRSPQNDTAPKQVVFVEPDVTDYQSLLTGLPPDTRYVVLNPNTDGLQQIAQYLKSHPGVDSIALLSHGSEAQVEVGGTVLDLGDLSAYRAELGQIGAAMKPGGDFLIYACDVAEGSDGQALVQQIASLSSLNVAASTHLVGPTSLGGSWTLDYDVGTVRAPMVFSTASEQRYGFLLSQTIEDYTSDPGFDSGFTSQFTLDGITYTIVKSGPQGDNNIGVDPTLQQLPDEGGLGNALQFDQNEPGGAPSGGISSITISLADGHALNFSSLDIDVTAGSSPTNGTVSFTASNGITSPTVIASNGNATSTTVSFSGQSAFQNTRSLTISGSNLLVNLGHLVYTDVPSPVLSASSGTTNYVGGTAAKAVDSAATVTDTSLGTLGNATTGTVTIGSHSSGDTLSFTGSAATGNITATFSNYVLTLTSANGSATAAQWTNAFDAVNFSSTSTTYGNRSISFVLNDGAVNSNTTTKTLDLVNPFPVITVDSGSSAFATSNDVAHVPSTPVTIDSGLTLTDSGSSTVQSATVSIASNYQNTDVLEFTANGTTFGNISGSYSAGVLMLTSAGNSATIAQWKSALDSVSYTSTAAVPSNATRTISFSITDANNNVSNTATRAVTVTDVDQIPALTIGNGSTNYVGGTAAVAIDTNIGVTDVDSVNQVSGTVSISNGFAAGDTLAFTSNNILYGNITGSYNTNNGTLTLTGSATDQQWANAFHAVTFSAANTTAPGNRTISFVVNDGTFNSAAVTKTVAVTAPPVITTDSGSVAFSTSNNVASVPSTPIVIDSTLGLVDLGSSTEGSATVSVTGNYQNTDVLGFTSNASFGNITGSYNAGVLTLTSAGNSATIAQWKSALDSVSYTSTAAVPSNATRTISFSITDGNNNVSNTATRLVTVTDVDQIPVLSIGNGTTHYVGGTTAVAIDTNIGVSDVDSTHQTSGTVTIGSGFSSGDSLSFTSNNILYGNITGSYNTNNGTLTLTGSATDQQWANAFNSVTFSSVSTTFGNRTISFVVNDGTFNSAAATKTVDVTDPSPVITADSGSAAFTTSNNVANVPSTPVTIDSGLMLTDPATSTLQSATVAITGNFQTTTDVLNFTSNANFGNIAGSYNAGVLTLTSAGNSATLAQWQAALDSVTYTSTAVTPNNATRTVSFGVTDAFSNVSNTATRHVTVTDVDQTPIVTTTNGTTGYVGGAAAVAVDTGVTVTDGDNANQASGTVTITTGFRSGDTLAFNNTSNAQFGNVTATYNGIGTLTLSGTATDQQWADAFDAVTFSAANTTTPGSRTISFVVNDGTINSAIATKSVDVVVPPLVTTDAGSVAFVAGDNVTSTPVAVDSGISVSDASSPTLTAANVSITGNFHTGEDVLTFNNTSSSIFGNISGSYDSATGVLTLTSSGASATLAQWQAALGAVTYTDTAITPNTATRTISFSVVDANSNTGNIATRTVTTADTDQTPIVTTTGGATPYVGGAAAIVVDSGVTVSDLDNPAQPLGTVSIGAGFHTGDTLAFTNTSATVYGNITGSYDTTTGVMTLTSAGATATDAQWANAFDSVQFSAGSSATPGNRTLSFVTNDGTENSVAATKIVTVIGPPSVGTDSGSAVFVAGDNVASTPVAVDSGISIFDTGSSTLAAANVAITGNFHSGEDVLSFANAGSMMGNIVGTYDGSTGVLTLRSSGASATLAQWQAALSAVTYTDTAITPNTATRTISINVTDGNSNTSNVATRTVTVAASDQTPIVTSTAGTTDYAGGTIAIAVDAGVGVSDRDNTTQSSATVSIASGFNVGDTLSFANTSAAAYGNIGQSYNATTGVLTLTSSGATATDAQWQSALDSVTFSAGSAAVPGNRTIAFVVNDGIQNSAAVTKTVDVIALPSVVTDSGSTSFVAADNTGSTPIVVDSGIALSDAGSSVLASATVAITVNFRGGEDVLTFANDNSTMGNVSGSYNAATGVLTLSSSGATATLAQWQAALRSVTYTDTAVTPSGATRTISFTVIDGNGNPSSAATRTVTLQDTDQTPIIVTTGGVTGYEVGPPATTIDSGITFSDRDNTTLASATVSIGVGFHSGDGLSLAPGGGSGHGNITATYDASTGVLTLSSPGAAATIAQWQMALESVQFSAPVTAPAGSRTISFAVNDGTDVSVVATKTVDVANLPFRPAVMPNPQVEQALVGNASAATTEQNAALIVLTALDPPTPVTGAAVVDAFRPPAPGLSSPPWLLSSAFDLQEPADVYAPIERLDATAQQSFSWPLTSPARGDAGERVTTDTTLVQVDGTPLPPWMHYDAATGVLSGTAPAGASGEFDIIVTVRHNSGVTTRREMLIDFSARGAPGLHDRTQPHAHPRHTAQHRGKPSLTEQFARQRSELHVSRSPAAARPTPVA